jgi:transposase
MNLDFLKGENDPELLRRFIQVVIEQNEQMRVRIDHLEKLEAEQMQAALSLDAAYSRLKRDYFGHGREKLEGTAKSRARGEDEQEVLLAARMLVPPPDETVERRLPRDAETHEMTVELLNEELWRRHPEFAGTEAKWETSPGWTADSMTVTMIERRFVEVVHRRQKYKTKIINRDGVEKEVILTAPGPEKILPGASYSIEFAVGVAADKYLMHLPLERQRRAMEAQGLTGIEVKTLYNLCWAASQHLKPIAEKIAGQILEGSLCVHADETPWPIQGKKDSNGQMWSISNMAGAYYRFEPSRSGKIIEEMTEGFKGALMSDAMPGYNRLEKIEGIVHCHCWAHVRRKFFDLEKEKPGTAREIIELLDKLFAVERKASTFEELKVLRETESKALIDEIRRWCEEHHPRCLPRSPLRAAINYTMGIWTGLTKFLTDTRIPLSNNDAERTLRHAVVGRKNYYGSKSIDGADMAATLFTVIESCKRVALDPRSYMVMAIKASARGETPPTPLDYARQIRPVPQA